VSSSAAHHLPPAYPSRASWGTAGAPRVWQQAAMDDYLARGPRDYLARARPPSPSGSRPSCSSAGSSTLTVVAPTEHLKRQWAEAAQRVAISLDPAFSGRRGRTSRDHTGVVVRGVASNPKLAAPGPFARTARPSSSWTRSTTPETR
jgi:hypothetical protein